MGRFWDDGRGKAWDEMALVVPRFLRVWDGAEWLPGSACEDAVDARPMDAELVRDGCGGDTGGVELADGGGVDAWCPALVPAGGLGAGDALGLPLAAEVGFKFGEDAEHVEEA